MTKQGIQDWIERIVIHASKCAVNQSESKECNCSRSSRIEQLNTLISDVVKEVIGEGLSPEDVDSRFVNHDHIVTIDAQYNLRSEQEAKRKELLGD